MSLDIKIDKQPKRIASLSYTTLDQLKKDIKVFRDETLVFRNQTQAIKNDADDIAIAIANIEDNIEAIEINITNLQQATEDDRILVQAALASCQQILIDVTALKVLTEGFKDDAEAAATQTALDAIATAADRVQTGLDVIATNADVLLTNADVVSSGANADAAEDFKDLSQAWAESDTEPDGVGTKSSKTWASEAEAARDEITDKINTAAPATLGNILRGDGTKYEPVNESLILTPAIGSKPLSIFVDAIPNTSGATHTYKGTAIGSFEVSPESFKSGFLLKEIPDEFHPVYVEMWVNTTSFLPGTGEGIYFWKDINNWIRIRINQRGYEVEQNISGTTTNILSIAQLTSSIGGGQARLRNIEIMYNEVTTGAVPTTQIVDKFKPNLSRAANPARINPTHILWDSQVLNFQMYQL